MFAQARSLAALWDNYLQHSDPRVCSWPLMSSPLPTIIIVSLYALSIPVLKKWMKDRPPQNIKGLLAFYNAFLVVLSAYMVVEMIRSAYWESGYSLVCNNMSYETDQGLVDLAKVLYIYYLSKFVEFFDTIAMVLRKQNDKVSFLHMYHHISMPLLWWVGIKWVAGGDSMWTALLNSFVHVLMYSHYLAASLSWGNLWWKPYLTQIQMLQFLINMMFAITSEFGVCSESYTFPRWMRRALVGYMVSLLVLFGNFYVRSYVNTAKTKKLE